MSDNVAKQDKTLHCAEMRNLWIERNEQMTTRLLALTSGLDEQTLNTSPDPSLWSPAQVVEHLVLTNRPYLQLMGTALQTAARVSDDPPVHLSFFGRILCKAAGPDGNAPAPKALHPRTTPIPITILQEWQDQQRQLRMLLDKSAGIDLSGIRVWNPLVRIIPMNLADCFALLTTHTERHLNQIAERLPTKTP